MINDLLKSAPKTPHRPMLLGVLSCLGEIFVRGQYADKAIERAFKLNRVWGSRDRQFVAKAVYDIVRWWRKLCYSTDLDHLKAAHFSREDFLKILACWLHVNEYEVPPWPEFRTLNTVQVLQKWSYAGAHRALSQSYPDWLNDLGEKELGARWTSIAHAMNLPAPVFLRANRIKTNRDNLMARLHQEGIETDFVPRLPDAVSLKERKNVFQTQAFKEGLFEVQDGGSQLISPFLDVAPGQRVIDACSGAGGKALHLAALLENKGKIIALDIHEHKLVELKRRARRAGVQNLETRRIDNLKVVKRLADSADRVLLDVPCSGLGVLRRNPDTKWKLSPQDLERVRFTQREILRSYAQMVKVGGKLVYATCSILPSENERQVGFFLAEQGGVWKLERELLLWPDENNFDGFYAARLLKLS